MSFVFLARVTRIAENLSFEELCTGVGVLNHAGRLVDIAAGPKEAIVPISSAETHQVS